MPIAEPIPLAYALAAAIAALLIGFLLAKLLANKPLSQLQGENARLQAELEAERRLAQERIATLEQAREQLTSSFAALSGQALRHNNEEFLRLARENLSQHQGIAQAELEKKEKSFEALVKPIREALEKTEQQVHHMEKERREAFGSLSQHLQLMLDSQRELRAETHNLVSALRRPEVRGQWGEMTLKRLVELAGMVEHCDFSEQVHQQSDEGGAIRPDMIVRMPDQRELVIDAKTPLDAYLSAVEAKSDEERDAHLLRHARKLREHMKELASKAYWNQFKRSPDFIVLFVPGDQFLSSALQFDTALLEDAIKNKVILATPTSLIALLRAVAFGWRQQSVAENAEKIRELGEQLYHRVATLTDHLAKLGKSLGASVDHYNKTLGSLERQLLPSARRFTELGIHAKKPLDQPLPLENTARQPIDKD